MMAMITSKHAVLSLLISSLLSSRCAAVGQVFLGSRDQHLGLQPQIGVSDLLAELENASGRDQRLATERRAHRLEGALRPMFDAMPKDGAGRLGSASVRYLLHRLFVQRHGWFVNGLENSGDSWNTTSPTLVFKEHAGEEVHRIFDGRLQAEGFTLHQVALFAATLENLVHTDNVERLQAAYRVLGFENTAVHMSEENATHVMRAYMMMYVLSMDHSSVTQERFDQAADSILTFYPTWPDTEEFAREVRKRVLADVVGDERTTWDSTLKVLEEVGERYGRWQDTECRALKASLVEMEEQGTGRVPLDKFYGSALSNSAWQFMESVPYMRQLGALDESSPERISVIIPNYLNSPSNCVASSKFYSVCCISECETLLGHLEDRIGSPDATPALITQLVSGLPSDTVQAPRQLAPTLLRRLEEVAAHHGGRVPLHGRLFAQWLHHVYPRECPYPHVFGTTSPMTASAYIEQTGESVQASHDDIRQLMNKTGQPTRSGRAETDSELPWSTEEELFVCRPGGDEAGTNSSSFGSAVRTLMHLGAVASLALFITKLFKQNVGALGAPDDQKYYV